MMTMDFKGITWVGDIYQKFETMCLEVEEDMYKDTVKYVENQVQTVGASVKKLYSDVMQDLLPQSSIDPTKGAAADLSLNPCSDLGISNKPKASFNEDPTKVNKLVSKDSKMISRVNVNHISSFGELHSLCHFLPLSSVGSTTGARSESEQNEDRGTYGHSNMPIKRKPKRNNHPSSAMLRSITPGSKNLSRESLCREISDNHEAVRDQIVMTSCLASVEAAGGDTGGEKFSGNTVSSTVSTAICDQIVMTSCLASVEAAGGDSGGEKFSTNTVSSTVSTADASIDMPTSYMILPVESCVNKETKLRSTYSNGGLGTCTNSEGVVPIELYASGDTQCSESATEGDGSSHTGRSGSCNLDLIENNGIVEPGSDTIVQSDYSKLEETCVLVDGDKLCLISNREDKPRSYKKKIRKVFSSKRSARKQEYERLAVQHGDTDAGSNHKGVESLMPTLTMDADTKQSPTHEFCESEWELL